MQWPTTWPHGGCACGRNPESFITYIAIWIAGLGTFFERHLMHFESVSTRTCVLYEIMIDYEYRTQLGMDRERERERQLGMAKVVLRGPCGCHPCKNDRGPPENDTLRKFCPRCRHCKTNRGPPYLRMSLRDVANFVGNSYIYIISTYFFRHGFSPYSRMTGVRVIISIRPTVPGCLARLRPPEVHLGVLSHPRVATSRRSWLVRDPCKPHWEDEHANTYPIYKYIYIIQGCQKIWFVLT